MQAQIDDDLSLIIALRQGDETAYRVLLTRYQSLVLRLARMYVGHEAAEEVAQETWLAVLHHIDNFEPRAPLKSWILRIAVNKARTLARREDRTIAFSSLLANDTSSESAVPPDRFLARATNGIPAGWWAIPPQPWPEMQSPEDAVLGAEVQTIINQAILLLRHPQREVIMLRDIQGLTAQEVCAILDITETHQRVLLHRARTKVRTALDRYFQEGQNNDQ